MPCLECGAPTTLGPRCALHVAMEASPYDDPIYRANRRIIVANATHCHLCGEPFIPDEPPTVDHVIPLAHGGDHSLENLRAAHGRCNSSAGGSVRSGY